MKNKLENWLNKTSLFNIYLFGATSIFILSFTLTSFFNLLTGAINLYHTLLISVLVGVIFGGMLTLFISMGRDSQKFYEIAKPLKERAKACNTKSEWEAIKDDIYNFYKDHKYGQLNNKYLNEITNILEIKKEYMK